MTEVSSHRQVLLELTHKLRVDANASNRQMIESAFQEVRTSFVVYWGKVQVSRKQRAPSSSDYRWLLLVLNCVVRVQRAFIETLRWEHSKHPT
jgi:hypothetical protein